MIDQILMAVCFAAGAWLAGDFAWKKLKERGIFQLIKDAVPDSLVADDGGFTDRITAIEHAERLLRYQVANGLLDASQHLRQSIAAMYLTTEDKGE